MFTAGSVTYALQARTGIGGVFGAARVVYMIDPQSASWGETAIQAKVRVTLDEQRSQIRMTVARSALGEAGGVAVGQRLTSPRVYTWHEHTAYTEGFNQPGGEYDIADMASSSKSYVAGTRSCVRPGS
jgi:hypothetical protein